VFNQEIIETTVINIRPSLLGYIYALIFISRFENCNFNCVHEVLYLLRHEGQKNKQTLWKHP